MYGRGSGRDLFLSLYRIRVKTEESSKDFTVRITDVRNKSRMKDLSIRRNGANQYPTNFGCL